MDIGSNFEVPIDISDSNKAICIPSVEKELNNLSLNIHIDFFKTGDSKMLLCEYVTDIIGNDFIKSCVLKVKIEHLLGTFALV